MFIIPTTQAEHIAQNLTRQEGIEVLFLGKNKDNLKYFPDGEIYVSIPQIKKIDDRVVVLHSGSPHPNRGLIELQMVLAILKKAQIKNIEVFFAYFPFGMQDNVWQTGELNMAKELIETLINCYNVKKIHTIDAHFLDKDWVKKYPIANISAVELLQAEAQKDFPDLVYSTPDIGAQIRTGIKGTEKKRKDSYTTEISADDDFKNKVNGKVIGAVDDLLETGGTMERFYDECKKQGALDAVAIITHGVLQKGIERVKNKYRKLYLTNTINQKEANIDISGLILDVLLK